MMCIARNIPQGSQMQDFTAFLPEDMDAFILRWGQGDAPYEDLGFGHAVCVKKHPETGHWHLLDSIKGRPLKLSETNWRTLKGSVFVLAVGSAYSRNSIMGARDKRYTQLTNDSELLLPSEVNITHNPNARPALARRQQLERPAVRDLLDSQGDAPEQTGQVSEKLCQMEQPTWQRCGRRLYKKRSSTLDATKATGKVQEHRATEKEAQHTSESLEAPAEAAKEAAEEAADKTVDPTAATAPADDAEGAAEQLN